MHHHCILCVVTVIERKRCAERHGGSGSTGDTQKRPRLCCTASACLCTAQKHQPAQRVGTHRKNGKIETFIHQGTNLNSVSIFLSILLLCLVLIYLSILWLLWLSTGMCLFMNPNTGQPLLNIALSHTNSQKEEKYFSAAQNLQDWIPTWWKPCLACSFLKIISRFTCMVYQ